MATFTQASDSSTASTVSKPTDLTTEETTAGKIEATLESLKPPAEPEEPVKTPQYLEDYPEDLKKGSQGDAVKMLQNALNALGYTGSGNKALVVDVAIVSVASNTVDT